MRGRTAAGALGLAALPVVCCAAPALAATDAPRAVTVDTAAWSWRTIVPAGAPATEPSNVPAGDLAISYDGRPDAPPAKATYLHLALGDLPRGTQVTNLLLTVPVDAANQQQDASTAVVVACRLKASFAPATGADPSTMPAEDCSDAVKGVYDAASSSFSFLLTGFAAAWAAGEPNDGVVLRPDPAAAVPTVLPFDVVLKGPAAIRGALSAVLPAVPVQEQPQPPAEQPYVPAPEAAPPPAISGGGLVPPPAQAPSTAPRPQVLPQLPSAPTASGPVLRQAVSRAPFRASAAGFAAAVALGLLLLVLVGWSLGEMTDPRWLARQERRRLDRLVRGAVVIPAVLPGAEPVRRSRRWTPQPTQSRQGRRPRSTATSTVTYS